MEDGFLRSVGLGSDFHRASSYVLDDLGIYFDVRRPSRLETLLQTAVFDEALLRRAAELRKAIVAAGLSKYNLREPGTNPFVAAGTASKILVVGQVEDDASIRAGCEDIASNLSLLRAARAARPDGFIAYKAHPDVAAGNRKGRIDPRELCDSEVRDTDIVMAIAHADEIHTMTSLAGFEGLLRGKHVVVYGRPFYAGWGLTEDRLDFPRRTRRLECDALVAASLILYPLYVDPLTRLPCTPEFLLERLVTSPTARAPKRGVVHSATRYLRAVAESLRTKPGARI
jgi:capsular polysaccharide export protein